MNGFKIRTVSAARASVFLITSLMAFVSVGEATAEDPFPAIFELSSLDGINGVVINGLGGAIGQSSLDVSSAGDINGDGIDDLLLGAGNAGQSYVVFGTLQGFDATFELSTLDGTQGFVINGTGGSSVSVAEDVNGDDIDDIVIGSWSASPNGTRLAGQSYVVFGTLQGFPATLDLSTLNGVNGFVVNGIADTDFAGVSVSSAGDVNDDGINDLIIGASGVNSDGYFNVGQAYVVFGDQQGFPAAVELSALDGMNGFVMQHLGVAHFDNTGLSVSSAGDVNGDGISDVIVGSPSANVPNRSTAGRTFVVFGTSQGFPAMVELSTLDGNDGFVVNGIADGDFSGKSVSSAGDINDDGIDDFIIGANGASPNGVARAGQSYVVFGNEQGFSAALELSDLDGNNGFVLNGVAELDLSGLSVSSAGDVNGDGIGDVIIGTPFASPDIQLPLAGQSYVVFGTDAGFSAAVELSGLDGANGFVVNGISQLNRAGWSVSSAGDVNGDGTDDLIIGSAFSDPIDTDEPGQSQSYVVFGRHVGSDPQTAVNYLSTTGTGTADGIFLRDEDIIAYDTNNGTWSTYFDGSDAGLGDPGQDVMAFHIDADGSILLSVMFAADLPDVGPVETSDIVRFVPTSTGDDTAGTFEMVLDGSDVELGESSGERIDAIGVLPDGRIVISPSGNFDALGLMAKDEDLIVFDGTQLGPDTMGSWGLYFDGSDVELSDTAGEDVNGVWVDPGGDIYLTTRSQFSVTGATGDGLDVFVCTPGSLGSDTSCTYQFFWDPRANGLTISSNVDGISLSR